MAMICLFEMSLWESETKICSVDTDNWSSIFCPFSVNLSNCLSLDYNIISQNSAHCVPVDLSRINKILTLSFFKNKIFIFSSPKDSRSLVAQLKTMHIN